MLKPGYRISSHKGPKESINPTSKNIFVARSLHTPNLRPPQSIGLWRIARVLVFECKTLLLATGLDRSVGPKSTLVLSPVRSETGILFMV